VEASGEVSPPCEVPVTPFDPVAVAAERADADLPDVPGETGGTSGDVADGDILTLTQEGSTGAGFRDVHIIWATELGGWDNLLVGVGTKT